MRAEGEPKQAEMLVFHAVLRAGSGDYHTICFLSGDVTPNNLEELCAQALERATDAQSSVRLTEVKVTLSGTQKESVVPEIRCRLRRLEPYGIKVVVA